MNPTMMLNAVGASVQSVPVFGFQPYYVDEDTARTIIGTTLKDEPLQYRFNDILDSFAKHSYWEVDLDWFMRENGLAHQGGTGAIMAKANELRSGVLQRNIPVDGNLWVLGCFSTTNKGYYMLEESRDWNAIELALKLIVSFIMESMINRPTTVYHTLVKQSVLERSKSKAPRFRSVHLTDVGKQYISDSPGHSGVKMPEHEVRGHWRHLSNGTVVFVRSHKRGDPAIPRKTVPIHVHAA